MPTLEDLVRLTMLLMFGNVNVVGMVLKGEDKEKLGYLTSVMTASRLSGKSTYTTWIMFFDEGNDNRRDCVFEAFLAYSLSWFVL